MTLNCKLIPEPKTLYMKFIEEPRILSAKLNIENLVDLEYYDGPYISIPNKFAQTYPTSNKVMREDFVVDEIQYAQVTNLAGGLTTTIGG